MGVRGLWTLLAVGGALTIGSNAVAQQAMTEPASAGVAAQGEVAVDSGEMGSAALVPPELAFAEDISDTGPAPSEAGDDAESFYRRYRRLNTAGGATGGIHLVDPSTGTPGAFRIQLATDFFASSDMLREGDEVDSARHQLSLSWTATEVIELFATLSSRASSIELSDDIAYGSNQSQSLQSTGDLSLGMKVGTTISGPWSLSGDARVLLLSGEGKASPELSATGLGLRAALALDLRQQPEPIPFIARLNVGYRIDNSSKLVVEREAQRYTQVPDARPEADETRHLANRFERLAFGMSRVDLMELGLGVELPLRIAEDFHLHPILEWTWGVPVNRQAYDCAYVKVDGAGTRDNFEDGCLENDGLAASPMVLSLALRAVTPLRGLSAFVGIDIGLLGTSTFVRELAPTAPYAVLLGLSVDYDARPAPVQVIEREVPVEAPPAAPTTGAARVVVVDAGLGSAIAGADVKLPDGIVLRSDDQGRVEGPQQPLGELRVQVTHPDYENAECTLAIVAEPDGAAAARCALSALPRKGGVRLRVVDVWGAPLVAIAIALTGPTVATLSTDQDGVAQREDLAAGDYVARVDGAAHYLRVVPVHVDARQTTRLDVTLAPRANPARASVRGGEVRLSGTVRFAAGSADLDASLSAALADVAELLLRNPDPARLRIEGPADAADPGLALRRAEAVRQRLVGAGVDAARLDAVAGEAPRLRLVVP